MKRVYISAPTQTNLPVIGSFLRQAFDEHAAPLNTDALYASLEGEVEPDARQRADLAWLAAADEVWVYGQGECEPSTRQLSEMVAATQLGIKLVHKPLPALEMPLFEQKN